MKDQNKRKIKKRSLDEGFQVAVYILRILMLLILLVLYTVSIIQLVYSRLGLSELDYDFLWMLTFHITFMVVVLWFTAYVPKSRDTKGIWLFLATGFTVLAFVITVIILTNTARHMPENNVLLLILKALGLL